MVQEGNIGLLIASKKYDPKKGAFSTYATYWIRERIKEEGRKNSNPIAMPAMKVLRLAAIKSAESLFLAQNGRCPSEKELQKLTGLDAGRIKRAFRKRFRYLSLDEPVGESQEETIGDILPASQTGVEDAASQALTKEKLEKCLGLLPAFDERILRLICGLDGGKPLSYTQLGNKLGVSNARVGQYRDRAIGHLRVLIEGESWL